MRYHASLFYSNAGATGLRLVVGEDDPRQAVKCYQAGDFISEAEAQRRGIYDILIGESEPGATVSPAAVDVRHNHRRRLRCPRGSARGAFERRPFMTPSIEERSYVENAVGSATPVTPAERAAAGGMGAEITGPTVQEIAAAGSYEAAADKASREMTSAPAATPGTPGPTESPAHVAARTPESPPTPPPSRQRPSEG